MRMYQFVVYIYTRDDDLFIQTVADDLVAAQRAVAEIEQSFTAPAGALTMRRADDFERRYPGALLDWLRLETPDAVRLPAQPPKRLTAAQTRALDEWRRRLGEDAEQPHALHSVISERSNAGTALVKSFYRLVDAGVFRVLGDHRIQLVTPATHHLGTMGSAWGLS